MQRLSLVARLCAEMLAFLCQGGRCESLRRFFLRVRLAPPAPTPSSPDRFRRLQRRVHGKSCIARRTEIYRLVSVRANSWVLRPFESLPAQLGFVFRSPRLALAWRGRGAFLLDQLVCVPLLRGVQKQIWRRQGFDH